MAGSIRRRPDKGADAFEIRVFVGRDAAGQVRHRSRLVRGTRRLAERELARMLTEQTDTPAVVPQDDSVRWGPWTTVNDAIEAWKSNGWDDLSPSTTLRYDNLWKVHIRDEIGRRRIASLGAYEIERWFRELKKKGLSQASVRQARAMLNRACRLARKWSGGSLPNPVSDTELPSWSVSERGESVRAPSVEEVQQLLASAADYDVRLAVLLRLAAATGARRGELCAVRWSDVDFEAGTVRLDEAVVAAAGGAIIRGPKTRASIRTIAVDDDTLAELRALHAAQLEMACACGEALSDEAFAFSVIPGGSAALHPDTVSHGFSVVRQHAGVSKDVHLHSLRHFSATLLDPVVSERQKQARLGWATVHMARHYTDAIPEEDRRAALHIGRVLSGRPQSAQ